MKQSESMKTFIAMCAEHGFSRRGKMFCRCIGDGIFQKISVACQDYMSPSSPAYSAAQRKSPCVHFGFWSMYSAIHELYFEEPRVLGPFYPENLLGERFRTDIFMGLPTQVQIMEEKGFPLLDSITTQKRLVEESRRLYTLEFNSVCHQITLSAPMLLCEEEYPALALLYGLYAENWLGFHASYDHLRDEGKVDEYLAKEREYQEDMSELTRFLNMVVGHRKEELRTYFLENLQKNTQLAKENKIRFGENYRPLLETL